VYSDDGGAKWFPSEPFPAIGTGEAAVVQLSNGTVYYNTRRHWAPPDGGEDEENAEGDPEAPPQSYESGRTRHRWTATSRDGTDWRELQLVPELPDGPYEDNFGLFGGLTRIEPNQVLGNAGIGKANGYVDVLLFSNVVHPYERRNGFVWLSLDGGKHWIHKRGLCVDEFGYSSLAAGRPGTPSEGWIYCFFEGGGATNYHKSGATGKVARFNVAWLFEGYYVFQ
jgi:sialidase-1